MRKPNCKNPHYTFRKILMVDLMTQFACKNWETMASKLGNRELLEGFWYFLIR